MVIEGQVRANRDAEVLGGSYRYQILTKERYGDVTGQLVDKLPHPKQDKPGFIMVNQKMVGATPLEHIGNPQQLGVDMNQCLLTQTRNISQCRQHSILLNLMTPGRDR